MAQDKLGNELKIGDLVQVQVVTTTLIGRVADLQSGGIVTPGGQKIRPGGQVEQIVTPGVVSVRFDYNQQFDPSQPQVAAILKVHDPNPKMTEKARQVLESEKGRAGLQVLQ